MKDSCIFCKIADGEIPAEKVFENENILAFLDINPVNLGHTLVIPKEHFVSLDDTPDETACEMIKAAKKIGSAMKEAIGAEGFNLGLNNGKAAGQAVSHVHLHVMPRYSDDGLELWPGKKISSENLSEAGAAIRQNII